MNVSPVVFVTRFGDRTAAEAVSFMARYCPERGDPATSSPILLRNVGLWVGPVPEPGHFHDLRRAKIFSVVSLTAILGGHQLVVDDETLVIDAVAIDRSGHHAAD